MVEMARNSVSTRAIPKFQDSYRPGGESKKASPVFWQIVRASFSLPSGEGETTHITEQPSFRYLWSVLE